MFKTKTPNPMFDSVTDIVPHELHELLTSGSSLALIDVRQPEEYIGELGHIDGAKLYVLDQFHDQFNDLKKTDEIVLICKSGARSARAAAFLHDQGYSKVYNMNGGMLAWNQLGFPIAKS